MAASGRITKSCQCRAWKVLARMMPCGPRSAAAAEHGTHADVIKSVRARKAAAWGIGHPVSCRPTWHAASACICHAVRGCSTPL